MSEMTNRERILALLRGQELDRVPFVQYDNIIPNHEGWEVIGRENLGLLRWTTAYAIEHPNCTIDQSEAVEDGVRTVRRTLHTPKGDLHETVQYEPTYGGRSTKEHYVKNVEDYEIYFSYLDDITVRPDSQRLDRAFEELGTDGLPHTWIGRTPYQKLWIDVVDIYDLSAHMVEAPEMVETAIEKLSDFTIRKAEATLELEPPFLVLGDNITAPMIGEERFRGYCLPIYNTICDLMATKGIPVAVHMDGDLKALWSAIAETKIRAIDSFSPPPDNDTPAGTAAELWPDKALMLNFPSSVHMKSPEEVYRAAMQLLEEAGHTGRLQIQISENVPPGVFRTSYPAILNAIHDFGRP
jgi:hypothetical protein